MDLTLLRTLNGFTPADTHSADLVKKFKAGSIVRADVKRMRNPAFHRKYFALLNVAFDIWSERCAKAEYKGQEVSPNFDRFRRDVAILCGFYEPVYNVKGEVRLEAKSISFANMSEDEFGELYDRTIDVLLSKVLPHCKLDREQLEFAAEQVVQFA